MVFLPAVACIICSNNRLLQKQSPNLIINHSKYILLWNAVDGIVSWICTVYVHSQWGYFHSKFKATTCSL